MIARIPLLLGLMITLLFLGCSATKVAQQKATLAENRQPLLIRTSENDKRPDWASEEPYFEEGEALHFAGGYLGGADYALSLRLAKAEAMKNLLESIEIKARAEFSTTMHGQNSDDHDLGRYVTDGVAWTVDNLGIRGIKQNTIYYEKIFDPTTQVFKYNSWVQLKISNADYLKAKTAAARRLLGQAIREKNEEAKEKASSKSI